MKFFAATVAAMVAAANGQVLTNFGVPLNYAAGPAINALPAQFAYAAPGQLAYAAPIQAPVAPIAAPIQAPIAAPGIAVAANRYNVPAPYNIPGQSIVSQREEKVEQHGYKIKF